MSNEGPRDCDRGLPGVRFQISLPTFKRQRTTPPCRRNSSRKSARNAPVGRPGQRARLIFGTPRLLPADDESPSPLEFRQRLFVFPFLAAQEPAENITKSLGLGIAVQSISQFR